MIIEANYIPKLEKLLNSGDETNHLIAFQIMSEIGAPVDLHPAMTDQISKIQLCILYGFKNIIAHRKVYMPDQFLQNTIRQTLALSYDTPISYQHLWRLETLYIDEPPQKNHFTFGLEDDSTNLEGLQFASQLKHLAIVNHEVAENELEAIQHLTNLEILKLHGISQGVFRMKAIQNWKPLAHLLQLKELHLIDSQLDNLAFLPKHLAQLELLNLQRNKLDSLMSLVDNPAIQHCVVDVRRNPLRAEDLDRQIARLKARKVEVLH